jgi:hypothetical protein
MPRTYIYFTTIKMYEGDNIINKIQTLPRVVANLYYLFSFSYLYPESTDNNSISAIMWTSAKFLTLKGSPSIGKVGNH